MDGDEKNTLLFTQLVIMFHTATMQQLGKIRSPLSDKIERDLRAAQSSIDLLEMLKEKTKGNLHDEESRLLSQVLQECRLNFVDEMNKPAEQATPQEQSKGEEPTKPEEHP